MTATVAHSPKGIAARFVEGRRTCAGFPDFPGPLPETLDAAYAIQTEAIAQWTRPVTGWKVGRITGGFERTLGEDRFLGPIFADSVWTADAGTPAPFPVIEAGFAALEAELVARVDCPVLTGAISVDDAAATIIDWHIGIEVAGSPCAAINDLGPLSSIAGFGNNIGLILGPRIAIANPAEAQCRVVIDGAELGSRKAAALPGGPMTAIAFALNKLHALGHVSANGILVSTGAITGVHAVIAGQSCTATFNPGGTLVCQTAAALP